MNANIHEFKIESVFICVNPCPNLLQFTLSISIHVHLCPFACPVQFFVEDKPAKLNS